MQTPCTPTTASPVLPAVNPSQSGLVSGPVDRRPAPLLERYRLDNPCLSRRPRWTGSLRTRRPPQRRHHFWVRPSHGVHARVAMGTRRANAGLPGSRVVALEHLGGLAAAARRPPGHRDVVAGEEIELATDRGRPRRPPVADRSRGRRRLDGRHLPRSPQAVQVRGPGNHPDHPGPAEQPHDSGPDPARRPLRRPLRPRLRMRPPPLSPRWSSTRTTCRER